MFERLMLRLLAALALLFTSAFSFFPKSTVVISRNSISKHLPLIRNGNRNERRIQPRQVVLTSGDSSLLSPSFDKVGDGDVFNQTEKIKLFRQLDKDFLTVALPAFVALAADPLASIVDAIYVGRLGPVDQAAMGIAISAQYSIAKLYNDPLLKTSTSLVAGKSGTDLEASVATAIVTALVIGTMQTILFLTLGSRIMSIMGVGMFNEMRPAALAYLKWRALGVPAATMLLVVNGIFRGRGDTQTPLYCTVLGNIVNIVLDPILIFGCHMGCAGAGAATAVSQWVTAVPLLYLLNKSVPIKVFGRTKEFYKDAFESYLRAGGLLLLRTLAKISAYAVTSSAAARMGTVVMAAYSLTFNLGFATSQLCESISIAAQALLARDYPFQTQRKKESAAHLIWRALWLGLLVSGGLSIVTYFNQDSVLRQLTSSTPVFELSKQIMPVVLATQLFKGLAYSTGGIILGGLDWYYSSLGMVISSVICVGMTVFLPQSLWNIWIALGVFMAVQVVVASIRFFSGTGPWEGIPLLPAAVKDKKLYEELGR